MARDDFNTAMTNRSLRTIKAVSRDPQNINNASSQLTRKLQELEFLTDASLISPQQLSSILSQLPSQTLLHAPLSTSTEPLREPVIVQPLSNLSLQNSGGRSSANNSEAYYSNPNPAQNPSPAPQQQQQQPPPPAYLPTPQPPPRTNGLAMAVAMYTYNPTDVGDLGLLPNDRVVVTEYMNAEWWKGRSERTGLEGIFPRSYVRVEENNNNEKAPMQAAYTPVQVYQPPPNQQGSNYGNVPLDVSQQPVAAAPAGPSSKYGEQGKKFGKKLGNAAVFGAGATIGSNIVNSIF